MTSKTEFASAGHGGVTNPFQGLARWAGVPLETVAAHARDGRLGELIESRQFTRPVNGTQALRRLEEKRHTPGDKPRSPDALIAELRERMVKWDAEIREDRRRRRDPRLRLTELRARRFRWDWDY